MQVEEVPPTPTTRYIWGVELEVRDPKHKSVLQLVLAALLVEVETALTSALVVLEPV